MLNLLHNNYPKINFPPLTQVSRRGTRTTDAITSNPYAQRSRSDQLIYSSKRGASIALTKVIEET